MAAFIVMCARVPQGVDSDDAVEIRDLLNRFSSELRQFTQPGTFMIFFLVENDGPARAQAVRQALEARKAQGGRLGELRIAQAVGELPAEFGWFGRLKSFLPSGGVVSEASKLAGEDDA